MKIVWCDNFDRDDVSERVVAENVKYQQEADAMLKGLRGTCTNEGPNWYKIETDDYKPREWKP